MRGFTLNEALVYLFEGKDAERYLHNRCTNNVKALQLNQCCQAAMLLPNGKIEVFSTIVKLSSTQFLVIVDGGINSEILAQLKRFLVADKVTVTTLSYTLTHLVPDSINPQLTNNMIVVREDAYLIPQDRGFAFGYDYLTKNSESTFSVEAISATEQLVARCLQFKPKFPEEITTDLLFSESQQTQAVSFTKGCYVGQEVVEKVDAKGKAPRLLKSFRIDTVASFLESPQAITAIVGDERKTVGNIISSVQHDGKTYGFAVVKNSGFSLPETTLQQPIEFL